MNPAYLGDSYDLVKRFFCCELSRLGYSVSVDAMLTGDWNESAVEFYRLIGAEPLHLKAPVSARAALFLDPDTGINAKGGKQHASFDRLALESKSYEIVFAFDQSFSRQAKATDVIREKLSALRAKGCYGMYYDSHARFVFVANQRSVLHELRVHLVALGSTRVALTRSRRLTLPSSGRAKGCALVPPLKSNVNHTNGMGPQSSLQYGATSLALLPYRLSLRALAIVGAF